jgi:hypothetical protein
VLAADEQAGGPGPGCVWSPNQSPGKRGPENKSARPSRPGSSWAVPCAGDALIGCDDYVG